MAANDYILNWSDNTFKPTFTLPAETIDTSSTSLTLVGRGTNYWGESVQENFLHLLEHFASNGTPPSHPTAGQIWFDNSVNKPKYFDGNMWRMIFDDSALTQMVADLNAIIASIKTVPVGGIIMWSGVTIPVNWALCDGNNGTPDLRNKFVMGASTARPVGTIGGSAVITAANLPSHTHTFTGTTNNGGAHSHSVSDPGHSHTAVVYVGGGGKMHQAYNSGAPGQTTVTTSSNGTGISIAATSDHSHTFNGSTSTSGGSNEEFYPPFYSLAYIMRL